MIYKSKNGDIELSKITRLYPAAVIDCDGEIAEMSLEWIQMNEDKVKLLHYVLVFDFTPQGDEKKVRTVLEFDTKDELINCMTEVAEFFQD
jgi:hypothetical protein